jgi:preprotein translocase subunit SecE
VKTTRTGPVATPTNFISGIPTFFRQVRNETAKVTWPTRAETIRTGIMVVILTTFLGVFFFGVDAVFRFVVDALLGLAK